MKTLRRAFKSNKEKEKRGEKEQSVGRMQLSFIPSSLVILLITLGSVKQLCCAVLLQYEQNCLDSSLLKTWSSVQP